jgi:hypothetical protein
MASYVFYPGDGVQTDWSVAFTYISQSHVSVTVAGTAVAFSWTDGSMMRVTPAVAPGSTLFVRRQTPTTPLTQFSNTNNLTADSLTLAETQALYIAEEARDTVNMTIGLDQLGTVWSAGGKRISNAAAPVDGADVATKDYVDTARKIAGPVGPQGI